MARTKSKTLSAKHRKFADCWLSSSSIVEAYEAVYGEKRSRRVAYNSGSVIYRRDDVQEYIMQRIMERDQANEGRKRELMEFWRMVRYGVIRDTEEEPLHHKLAATDREAKALGMFIEKREDILKGQVRIIFSLPEGCEKI
ncbi:MAG TPA: terminase small subunit [Spirochaetota bacterium]|nr:terminase small subunit [Spirochaetota bacterium]